MIRRTVAGGAVVVVLILLVLGVRGCLDARKERALKDYARDAAELVNASNQQSKSLFDVLRGASAEGGQRDVELETQLNSFAVEAEQLVDRAKDADPPDEMKTADRYLVETLELRRDGTRQIARLFRAAVADEGAEQALASIAANMRLFDASDVIYSQRVVPNLKRPLQDEGVQGEVVDSQFLPDIDWLRPRVVADRFSRIAGGEGGGGVAPGLHGTGLVGVTVQPSGQTLAEGGAIDLKASEQLAFDVNVQNQGENEERDVAVVVTISGAGEPIELEERLDTIAPGESKTVRIPIADQPPTGRPVEVKVESKPVPGEKKTDNNKLTARAIFTK
jgi:hypothetical protein